MWSPHMSVPGRSIARPASTAIRRASRRRKHYQQHHPHLQQQHHNHHQHHMALATPDTILHQQQHYYQTTKREDLEGAQKVSDAALAYFDKLKPSRVDSCVEYWQVELFSSSGWAAAYLVVQWLWQIAYHEKKIFIFTSQVSVTSEKSCLEIDIFSISTPKAIQLAHSSCRMISVRRIIQFGFGSTPQSRSSHRLGRRGRQRDRP